jgi:hypothetical protein
LIKINAVSGTHLKKVRYESDEILRRNSRRQLDHSAADGGQSGLLGVEGCPSVETT